MDNVFEQAVYDFSTGNSRGPLLIHNTYGDPDEMPLEVYFRTKDDLSDLEIFALELCEGKILDIGAGVGALSLILQKQQQPVEALEISSKFCAMMRSRGLANVLKDNFLTRSPSNRYDTLLMMMNGFGLCGSIHLLPKLFEALDRHLAPGGQVIFDSSDLSYLYEDTPMPKKQYYGEMDYRYEYGNNFGPWFKWLYIDAETLAEEAYRYGFVLQVLFMEGSGQYLGRLTRDF